MGFEEVVRTSAKQLNFLYSLMQHDKTENIFQSQATAELDSITKSLKHQDEIVKNLKIENEYLTKQLDTMRREQRGTPLRDTSHPRTISPQPQMISAVSHQNLNNLNNEELLQIKFDL